MSLLKAFKSDGHTRPPPPPPITIAGDLYYDVDQVVDHREKKVRKKVAKEYLVKWVGYDAEHNTWEPEAHFEHCPQVVEQYWELVNLRKELTNRTGKQGSQPQPKVPGPKAAVQSAARRAEDQPPDIDPNSVRRSKRLRTQ